jgi:hypothetical protein
MAIATHLNPSVIAAFCEGHGISRLRLFGSFARGEETSQSDLDLIADFSAPVGLFEVIRIERELSDLLGVRVDLLTEGAISPYIKERIADDIQVLYEAR